MGVVTPLRASEAFTRADLDALPDDGRRHELLDGVLIVTPAPVPRHQRAQARLLLALAPACPPGLEIMMAPLDVVLAADTVLQPDLLVAATADFSDKDLPITPRLAVEILSPSTRRFDLLIKRARYEAAGCPSYWIVDPDAPSLVAWELRDGAYVEAAHAVGDEVFTVASPFSVSLRPSDLVAVAGPG